MQQAGEPSVEEILQSIKKVIARESGLASGTLTEQGGDPRPEHLTERRPEHRAEHPLQHAERVEPALADEAEEVLELDEDAMIALADEDGTQGRYDDAPTNAEASAPLTAAEKSSAIRDNFAALAMLAKPGREPQIVRSGETSLEGLTRDLLRPLLAQWLDENLAPMVEELVKAEIARIAGKKR